MKELKVKVGDKVSEGSLILMLEATAAETVLLLKPPKASNPAVSSEPRRAGREARFRRCCSIGKRRKGKHRPQSLLLLLNPRATGCDFGSTR